MTRTPPHFYLYGEPHRSVEESFIHVESLDDRSRPNKWTIAPHSHPELAHIFYVSDGGGIVHADAQRFECRAPCLLLMPASVVHGFDWEEDVKGFVIALSIRHLSGLAALSRDAATLLSQPEIVPLSPDTSARIGACVMDLMQELSGSMIGYEAAVQSALLAIFVVALRWRTSTAVPTIAEGRSRATVARLRDRIEERFRLRESVAHHASALGMSETALRVACTRVAGISPAAMLNQRAILEAQRSLIFSDLTISEIAFSLGFADAAYFSRFFKEHVGQSPRNYRAAQRSSSIRAQPAPLR